MSDKAQIIIKPNKPKPNKRIINLQQSPKGIPQLRKAEAEKFKKRTIKMTDRMYDRCCERAAELGMSFSELGRQSMANGTIVAAGFMEQLAGVELEIRRQGHNLNQCTRELNSEKFTNMTGHEHMVLARLLESIERLEVGNHELLYRVLQQIEHHLIEIRKHGIKLILRVEVPVADTNVSATDTKPAEEC